MAGTRNCLVIPHQTMRKQAETGCIKNFMGAGIVEMNSRMSKNHRNVWLYLLFLHNYVSRVYVVCITSFGHSLLYDV